LLKKRGAKLSAGYYLRPVSNYLPLPHNDLNSREAIALRSTESRGRLDEIVALLERGDKTVEKVDAFLMRTLHPILLNISGRYDRRFSADGNCTSCGTCEKVCPVNNITMKDGKPVWWHDCQFCLACIHFCPQRAIQWNGVTQEKGRYHDPCVTAADIAKQKEFVEGGMLHEFHRS
jgi:ferredoxin